jgi:hypothetical protein
MCNRMLLNILPVLKSGLMEVPLSSPGKEDSL